MHGPPQDVDGACNAWLLLGDDYGDNTTTIRCTLPPGHEGEHVEELVRKNQRARFTWDRDESVVCPAHGRGEGPECQACARESELAQESEPPSPPPTLKYLFDVTVMQSGFWPDQTGDAVDKSDTYTVIATDPHHALHLARAACKFGEFVKVERTSREPFGNKPLSVWLADGLRRRMPDRGVEVLGGPFVSGGFEILVDGRRIPYDTLDTARFVQGPVSDATDAQMLDGLMRAIEDVLAQKGDVLPKESP